MLANSLTPSGPRISSGLAGSWPTKLGAKSSSATSRSPWALKNLLTHPPRDGLVLFRHRASAPFPRFPRRVVAPQSCIVEPSEAEHMSQMHYFCLLDGTLRPKARE